MQIFKFDIFSSFGRIYICHGFLGLHMQIGIYLFILIISLAFILLGKIVIYLNCIYILIQKPYLALMLDKI